MPQLLKDGPEQRAIDAGEIDAIIDYSSSNVILLPAARRALQAAAADEFPIANSLLAAIPRAEYQRLLPSLELLTLKFGEMLQEPGAPIRHVYFPVDCVISLLAVMDSERTLEVGQVGYEGMCGISLALGVNVSSVLSLVQVSGTVLRMSAAHFGEALRHSHPLQRELYRYAHAKLSESRRTIACNRFHAIEARLARWLLMTSDRVRSDEFSMTQAFLAHVLGVRRGAVNEAAGSLQRHHLIGYSRGKIRILDRKGLEASSCRCYVKIDARACYALAMTGMSL